MIRRGWPAVLSDCCVLEGCRLWRERRAAERLWMVSVHGVPRCELRTDIEQEKGIRWMPWHQEAMKDVARCEKPRGAASRR